MAFLKLNEVPTYNGTTKYFKLGLPEAESETYSSIDNTESVFSDFLDIQQHVTEGKFIISGRKGTGKSAFVKYLMDNSSEKNDLYTTKITPSDVHLHKVINSVPDDLDRYTILYEWVILCTLGRMIVNSDLIRYRHGAKELQEFFKKNSGIVEIDKFALIEEYSETNIGININSMKSGVFSPHFNKAEKASTKKPSYYSFIPTLRSIITEVLQYECIRDKNFLLLFDDLDLSFNLNRKEDKEHLLDLIRLAKVYNTQYLVNTGSKILLFIRDDVAKNVSGIAPDRAKIFGAYEYRLNWYNHEGRSMKETDIILRKFINRRIAKTFERLNVVSYNRGDPWLSFVDNSPKPEYGDKTAFRYILNMTFYRPRDIVNIFRDIEDANYQLPLNVLSIQSILKKYVRTNIEEIKDELSILFSEEKIEQIISLLRQVANHVGDMRYEDIQDLLSSKQFDDNLLSTLCQYNLLIPKDRYGKLYFTYREQDFDEDYENYAYVLPQCIYLYFKPNLIAKSSYSDEYYN